MFHSLINKYATKRIHWKMMHYARLACIAMDLNENRTRELLGMHERQAADTTVWRRTATSRILSKKTECWKDEVASLLFGDWIW